MIEKGLIEKPAPEPVVKIQFPNNSHIPPPVMAFKEVSFAYDHDKSNLLLKDMEFGIDMDSRIVLVGPNGAGKSTLQKVKKKKTLAMFLSFLPLSVHVARSLWVRCALYACMVYMQRDYLDC